MKNGSINAFGTPLPRAILMLFYMEMSSISTETLLWKYFLQISNIFLEVLGIKQNYD